MEGNPMLTRTTCLIAGWLCLTLVATAQDPCRSGLQPGLRPGPYTALVSTGPQRGQLHCFICETGDRPAVIIFARKLSAPLGKLAHQIDKALNDHKAAELRAWVTFLNENQPSFDPKVVAWAKDHSVGTMPLGVHEVP